MTEGFAEAELEVGQQSVLPDWIDYNGHMNVAYYVLAFDRGVDEFMYQMGITPEYLKTEKSSTFTLEMHINYLQELRLEIPSGSPVSYWMPTVNGCTISCACSMPKRDTSPPPANR